MRIVISYQLSVISFCFLLFTVSFAADPLKTKSEVINKEKRLESLKRELIEKKKSLEYNVKKEYAILGEVERLDKSLSKKEDELADIDGSLMKLKQKTQDVDGRVVELQQDKERLSGLLKQRLAAMYKMKKGGIMQSLFSFNPVNDLDRRYKYINKIVEYDGGLLKEYEENQLLLETEKQRLKEFEIEMLSLKDEIKHKKNEAEEEKDKKRIILKDIKKQKGTQIAAIREMEDASKELQSFLDRFRKDTFRNDTAENAINSHNVGFAAMRGHLPMPVEGKVVSIYGKVEHPKFHTITFNNGIEIAANIGTEVRSVYNGRIAYSGWFRGYGKVVIVEHGGGYYTLFARLSKIVKDINSTVEKGDVLALVGDTGSIKGPHLYFEVRQKGIPLDPLNWVAYNTK